MSEYDGKVHIFTGLYWGFLVSYLAGYSTFLAWTAGFLIVTYYTQPTYHRIINATAQTFYERVIASSIEKIIDELASTGVTDLITGVVLFAITTLKSILGSPKAREGAKSKAESVEPLQSRQGAKSPAKGVEPLHAPQEAEMPTTSLQFRIPKTLHRMKEPESVNSISRLPVPPKIRNLSLKDSRS